jgi:hypothetical protein
VEPQDTTEVIDAIEAAVDSAEPFLRVAVGRDATSLIDRRAEMGDAGFVRWMADLYGEPSGR